jgi:hypothetical protein
VVNKSLFWGCLVLAFAGGILAWRIDSRNDEPQAAVLVILVVTFLLGFLLPRRAWLWAAIVGLCLPLGYLVSRSVGFLPQNPVEPGWYASAIALIPAFIGAYAGALGRIFLNAITVKTHG